MTLPPSTIHLSDHASHRQGAPLLAIVLHHTAGTDSLSYLTHNDAGVSTHVLIPKDGTLIRMVPDALAAHTVGFSTLGLYLAGTAHNPNLCTLNIEIENRGDGVDPYPEVQVAAVVFQVHTWWATYGFLPVIGHALIDTQGKTDPRGWDWPRFWRLALGDTPAPPLPPAPASSPLTSYTDQSPLLATVPEAHDAFVAAVQRRCAGTRAYDVTDQHLIASQYWLQATALGLDPWLAMAQCLHETANLSSWWAARPRRNPAGIGVTGQTRIGTARDSMPPSWAYDDADRIWRHGLSFHGWLSDSIPAHLGRLLAYATLPATRTPAQQQAVTTALSYRTLPAALHGSAPILQALGRVHNPTGQGWASPGTDYGAHVATLANALRGSA
jgi:hypothetical protein